MQLRWMIAVVLLAVCVKVGWADQKPLKVFVLVGQSNMQGHANVRTLDHIGMDPKTAPILEAMLGEDGEPIVCEDVWISSLSSDGEKSGRLSAGFGADASKIGPEFTFGIYAQKLLNEPVLIVKTAWGGKSLHTDFRPPSGGPYEFNEGELARLKAQGKDLEMAKAEKLEATGRYYHLMINHVRHVLSNMKQVYPDYDEAQGYELAGLVWFQGWNDMVDSGVYPDRGKAGGYDRYSDLLAKFIRDVRKDLGTSQLPIVIGVMGVGGPVDQYLPDQKRYARIHQNFRDAMAAPATLPEFKATVKAVLTERYWDMELVALRAREAKVKQKLKALQDSQEMDREAVAKAREELMSDEFTDQERASLEGGVSNFEFHYLGSAKILAQIGKGFAEAIVGDDSR